PYTTLFRSLELLRIAQEFDDFLKVLLGFVHAGDVLESHAAMRFGQKLGLRLAKAHRTARAALHLAHEENPHAEDQDHRQPRQENANQRAGTVSFRARGDRDVLAFKARDETRIARRIGLEGRTIVGKSTGDPLAGDRHRFHATIGYVVNKLRIGNFTGIGALTWALEQVEQRDQKKSNDRP